MADYWENTTCGGTGPKHSCSSLLCCRRTHGIWQQNPRSLLSCTASCLFNSKIGAEAWCKSYWERRGRMVESNDGGNVSAMCCRTVQYLPAQSHCVSVFPGKSWQWDAQVHLGSKSSFYRSGWSEMLLNAGSLCWLRTFLSCWACMINIPLAWVAVQKRPGSVTWGSVCWNLLWLTIKWISHFATVHVLYRQILFF